MRDVLPFVSLMKDIDYIEIKYHHFCSLVENGDVEIKYVDSKEQIAGIFMELLGPKLYIYATSLAVGRYFVANSDV